MRVLTGFTSLVLSAALLATAVAEEKTEVVLDGLDNPTGVAIQPGTGHIFVADSGAAKIVRIVDGKAEDVVVDFPLDVYGKGPMYNIGPLGLAFLDKDTLVVGDGSQVDKEELVRVYTVPAAGEKPLKATDTKVALGPLPDEGEIKAEGNYYGVAISKNAVYVTCNGDDTKGWIARATINGTKFGKLERYIATKEATNVDAPVAITISPRGEVVVGQMGEITVPGDGLLTFYNAKGKMLMNLETGLSDITGVAYSPKGHLYAVDFAWAEPTEGGLFRLDSEGKGKQQTLKAVKITGLEKPSALAFDKSDGSLYITIFGKAEEGKKTGQLIKLAPGL